MFLWILVGYVLLGVITIAISAYDPFSQTFDWGLSGGWEFFWWQRYVTWFLIILGWPYFLIKVVVKKMDDRKYVKEWREKGHFTRKL